MSRPTSKEIAAERWLFVFWSRHIPSLKARFLAQSGHSAKLPTSAFQVRALCAQQSFSRIYRSTWLSDFRRRNDLAPQKIISLFFFRPFAAFLAESFFPFL